MATSTLIDLVVVLGVAVILPLALPSRGWGIAAPGVVIALARPEGWSAAMFVAPWIVVGLVLGLRAVVRLGPVGSLDLDRAAEIVAAGFCVVAAGALVLSRLGLRPFGIREPIVELTAVHFTYAGAGALALARANLATQPGRIADLAVVLTAVAPPVVAVGFVTEGRWAQVGGAVLMTAGVWATAVLHLRAAGVPRLGGMPLMRVLLGISGVAVWVPMVLAVGWAAAQHWDIPALSIAAMARVHGTLNALGFTLCGLIARRLPT